MKKGLFHFKQFSVSHERSSMKVGVDGVLIGSWASPKGKRILDAGTGCGLIALMLAQRIPESEIIAIDIDKDSIDEAVDNFNKSKWNSRIHARQISFNDIINSEKESFDLIVSNPPFYNAGLAEPMTSREIARHQSDFSPTILIEGSFSLLKDQGRVAMIVPSESYSQLRELGISKGFCLDRVLFVRNRSSSSVKRVMMEFIKCKEGNLSSISLNKGNIPVLTLFNTNGNPTEEYLGLGKDFYLKF